MEKYCSQNNGECETCSLVNYGLDCRNNPIAYVKDGRCQCDRPIIYCERHHANHYGSSMGRLDACLDSSVQIDPDLISAFFDN